MEDIIINLLENLKNHSDAFKTTEFNFSVDGKEINIDVDIEKV